MLRCSCFAALGGARSEIGTRLCPAHALQRAIARTEAAGLSGKHPLFPGNGGKAIDPEEARARIRQGCREPSLSEHSLRRMGAQFYARRGLALPVIQHLGRWGSAAVERYVAEALEARAAWAPLAASENLDLSAVVGGDNQKTNTPGLGAISGMIREVVKVEVSKAKAKDIKKAEAEGKSKEGSRLSAASSSTTDRQQEKPRADPREAIRSSITRIGHIVRLGGPAIHPVCWETLCGWRFGCAPHERCRLDEVTCRRGCALALAHAGDTPTQSGQAGTSTTASSSAAEMLESMATPKKRARR